VAAFLTDELWPSASIFALGGGGRGAVLGLGFAAGVAALVFGMLAAVGPAASGAGQPAVVALAASMSGLASATVGLALGNPIVATVGGLVAAAGYSLSGIVGKALGRTPLDIAFGRGHGSDEYTNVKACGAEEAAMELETARKVIVVPGYGMAVAQAQHALADVAKVLAANGT
jgi:NAD(P) transhydrogenase subunit beta